MFRPHSEAEHSAGTPTGHAPGSGRALMAAFGLAFAAAPVLVALHVVLVLLVSTFPVAVGWATKLTLDAVTEGDGFAAAAVPVACLAVAGIAQAAAPHALAYLRAELDRSIGMLAQNRLFRAVGTIVGLGPFENPAFLDRLRLAKQSGRHAPGAATDGLLGAVGALVTLVGFMASLTVVAPAMTAFVALFSVPVLVAEVLLARRRARALWTIGPAERRELFYDQLLTSVAAAKEIRLLGIAGHFLGRMQCERRAADTVIRREDRREVFAQSALAVLAACVAAAGLLWAVSSAVAGTLSAGDVAIFVAAVAGVQSASALLAAETGRTHQALELFEHYRAVTAAEPDLPAPATPRMLPGLSRGIEFSDVSFRYGPEHPWVLRHVSFTIPFGQAVALVGLNGAGKSTLVKLLCRFYDPTEGQILWDGVDIREVDPAALRDRLGAVFQDFMHYDLPAREAIALGDLSAVDDLPRIEEAARRAGVHRTLSELPHGYETLLSRTFFAGQDLGEADTEAGVMLSGGQSQRLALARAFLRADRDLLILDEPSAGLDAEAEYEIHTALTRLRGGRTSVLISHRLGSVREADHIVVMADGSVAEQGRHLDLMAKDGVYARLFTLQASGYRQEELPV
ncbi:ABC transporter ATP-binding protein [Streptomyces erythrochromogenes]|uniref:ABC transporter ATP-binding protein n=1 Tax=Streptomyces erythrochromogenes TaxID=285574 RepID=UPI00342CB923